jgi:hypothetical protein
MQSVIYQLCLIWLVHVHVAHLNCAKLYVLVPISCLMLHLTHLNCAKFYVLVPLPCLMLHLTHLNCAKFYVLVPLPCLMLRLTHLNCAKFYVLVPIPRLKISGVTSQFAIQISGIAIQSPHLICSLLHKITPKLIRNVKNCYTKLFFSIVLCEKFRKLLHIEKKVILSPAMPCLMLHLTHLSCAIVFVTIQDFPIGMLNACTLIL